MKKTTLFLTFSFFCFITLAQKKQKPNILFIAIDVDADQDTTIRATRIFKKQ